MTKKLSPLEELLDECEQAGIHNEQALLPENINAVFYVDNDINPVIAVNGLLITQAEQTCAVAEELGHYYTSYGDILADPSTDEAIVHQQEDVAKKWAVKRLVTLPNIVKAYEAGCRNLYEMAEYLDVTEAFLSGAFEKYNKIYGKCRARGTYIIYFDPPGVLKLIDR